MNRLLGHAERRRDLFPDNPFVPGSADKRRFPAFDFASAFPNGRELGQDTIGPRRTLLERGSHDVNIC